MGPLGQTHFSQSTLELGYVDRRPRNIRVIIAPQSGKLANKEGRIDFPTEREENNLGERKCCQKFFFPRNKFRSGDAI